MSEEDEQTLDYFSQPETVGIDEEKLPSDTFQEGPPAPYLLFIAGPEIGRTIRLTEGSVDIGRSSKCDVTVTDPRVSRRHAEIVETAAGFELRDLDSSNGTWVRDERIEESFPIEEGTRCVFGVDTAVVFTFQDPVEESFYREMYESTVRDALTGAYDKGFLKDRLESVLSSASNSDETAQLLFFDIDDFKVLNDRFGHPTGDEVLERIAKIVRSVLDETEREGVFARYGGDEFALVFRDASDRWVDEFGDELRDQIAETTFVEADDDWQVQLSVGTASSDLVESDGVAEFVYAADRALYDAKASGGNRVVRRERGSGAAESDQTIPPISE